MAIKKTELYSSLWQSCDELRGGMDASQYKDYVLTLLFVKYVSDKYGGQPYAVITVPAGGSFADMVKLKGDKEIGDKMNKAIRAQLKQRLPALVVKWETAVGEPVAAWGVKKMKTKWGSCNIEARRIWLNLELAKKPPECLEYILVHEMAHFLVRHHNEQFRAHMDRLLPDWRLRRDMLNAAPLAHEDWAY